MPSVNIKSYRGCARCLSIGSFTNFLFKDLTKLVSSSTNKCSMFDEGSTSLNERIILEIASTALDSRREVLAVIWKIASML